MGLNLSASRTGSDKEGLGRSKVPSVSVIISAWTLDRWSSLKAAVSSCLTQTAQPSEVLVVVDHNPALLERVHAELSGVTAIENTHARGTSGTRNAGAQAAAGDVIAFIDDDAEAEPDWLERLLPQYQDPDVIGVGGAIIPHWVTKRPLWFPDEFLWVVGCTYEGLPDTISPVRKLIGCNMTVRREAFLSTGGFLRELGHVGSFPIGGEETEWSIRVLQSYPRGRFIYVPQARVQHQVPFERSTFRYFRRRCFLEGVSKGAIVRVVGAANGLATEWDYSRRVLPRGVAREVTRTFVRDADSGIKRAAAIIAGFTLTTAGYAVGRLGAGR